MEISKIPFIILVISLFVIMLGVGISLSLKDFKAIKKRPKALLLALACQMIILPLICYGVGVLLSLPPELAFGLMLLGVSPGGPTSNYFSKLGNADVALSVSLTVVNSVISIITIPIVLGIFMNLILPASSIPEIPIFGIIKSLVVVILVPVGIGMTIKTLKPDLALRMETKLSKISLVLFAGIVIYVAYDQWDALISNLGVLAMSMVLVCFLAYSLSFLVCKFGKLKPKEIRAVVIEVGIQNSSQAITLASSPLIFNNSQMALPGAIYTVFMYISIGIYLGILYSIDKKTA